MSAKRPGLRRSSTTTTTSTTAPTQPAGDGGGEATATGTRADLERAAMAPRPEPERSEPATKGAPPAAAGVSAVRPLALRAPAHEWDEARAAYMSDWRAGGQADTFQRWLAGVIDSYVRRPIDHTAVDPLEAVTDHPKTHKLPTDTLARLSAAVAARQAEGLPATQTEVVRRAMAAAVEVARTREGGHLPPVTGRLPNRLVR